MRSALEYVIDCCCQKYDGGNGNEFTTATFQSELSRVTDSKPMITPQVAELILMSIGGVVRQESRCHWRFLRRFYETV